MHWLQLQLQLQLAGITEEQHSALMVLVPARILVIRTDWNYSARGRYWRLEKVAGGWDSPWSTGGCNPYAGNQQWFESDERLSRCALQSENDMSSSVAIVGFQNYALSLELIALFHHITSQNTAAGWAVRGRR